MLRVVMFLPYRYALCFKRYLSFNPCVNIFILQLTKDRYLKAQLGSAPSVVFVAISSICSYFS